MALLGYIGNTAVYDDRLVTEGVKARVPARIEKEHLEGTRCLCLVKETTLWRQGFYYKLRDGLVHEGKVTATFYEKGAATGGALWVSTDPIWAEDQRAVADLAAIRPHYCHAPGCQRMVPPKFLMCRYHWGLVPKAMQDAVWQSYQPDQELGKTQPTQVYLDAADMACKTVACIEAGLAAEKARKQQARDEAAREAAEKRLRKQGGQAAKEMFKEQA